MEKKSVKGIMVGVLVAWVMGSVAEVRAFPQSNGVQKTKVRVSIQKILAPTQGYDDNDEVKLMISGELPNPCYSLEKTEIKKTDQGKTMRVIQWAWLRQDGVCGSGDLIDSPSSFEKEISLGTIEAGEYRIEGLSEAGKVLDIRKLQVAVAPVATLDSLNYAVVGGVWVDDLVLAQEEVQVTLVGQLTHDCMELKHPMQMTHQNDVFVILPVQEQAQEECRVAPRPFRKTLSLGRLKPGMYLIHVRSRNGQTVQKAISVLKGAF